MKTDNAIIKASNNNVIHEIKCNYVDSKHHFYLQYYVAATDMKALC